MFFAARPDKNELKEREALIFQVFAVEYKPLVSQSTFLTKYCPLAKSLKYDLILKNRDLDAPVTRCPASSASNVGRPSRPTRRPWRG